MPIYLWRCESCGSRSEHHHPIQQGCQCKVTACMGCGGAMRRDYRDIGTTVVTAFKPHYNYSVGQYVHSMREFKDALNRGSDEQSERTGMDHRYVPIEYGEAKNTNEEGLESTYRERRKLGLDKPKRTYH